MEQSVTTNILKSARSPTLDTIKMVEKFIDENSGEYTKAQLFQKLPKKVMWGTFNVILKYLWESNKIGVSKTGILVYIWNPELAKRYLNRKSH